MLLTLNKAKCDLAQKKTNSSIDWQKKNVETNFAYNFVICGNIKN